MTPPLPIAMTYYLLCSSKEECESWQVALKTAIRMCTNSFRVLREAAISTITRADQGQFSDSTTDRKLSTTSSASSIDEREKDDSKTEEIENKSRSESTSSSKSETSKDSEKEKMKLKTFSTNADRRPGGWKDSPSNRGSGTGVPLKDKEGEKEKTTTLTVEEKSSRPPPPQKKLPSIEVDSVSQEVPTSTPSSQTNSKLPRKSLSFADEIQAKKNLLQKEQKVQSRPSPPENLSPLETAQDFEEDEEDWEQDWVELITESGDVMKKN